MRASSVRFLFLGSFLYVAGCAGTAANSHPNNANDDEEGTPANKPMKNDKPGGPKPPDSNAIAKAKQPAPVVSVDERADFDKAVAKWQAAVKGGTAQSDCGSLSDAFVKVAGSHKQLAAQAHFNAGTILEQCGPSHEKDAESEYNASLSANAAYGPALNNLGQIYYRRGNISTAKDWFQKGIDADPTHNAPAYNNLAIVLYGQAQANNDAAIYKDAISKLRRALAIDSESVVAYNLLALIYLNTAESDKSKLALAELVVTQGKEANEKFPPIYNTYGLIELRRKNVTAALQDFEKAVALDPNYIEALLNIGAIDLSSRQYAKAEQAFTSVNKLQPKNVDAIIGLGVANRGQRKIDEAEKFYKQAADIDSKACAVPYKLGLLYHDYKDSSNGVLKQAQQFYQQFLSCSHDKDKVADAQRRIKDVDDTIAAIEKQKVMEKEQQELLKQQQEMMQKQQQQQQQANPSPAPAAAAPAAAPAPAPAAAPAGDAATPPPAANK